MSEQVFHSGSELFGILIPPWSDYSIFELGGLSTTNLPVEEFIFGEGWNQ